MLDFLDAARVLAVSLLRHCVPSSCVYQVHIIMKCQRYGRLVGSMQCHKCDCMEVRQPMDITTEQLEKEGKAIIMRFKEHFMEQGWRMP